MCTGRHRYVYLSISTYKNVQTYKEVFFSLETRQCSIFTNFRKRSCSLLHCTWSVVWGAGLPGFQECVFQIHTIVSVPSFVNSTVYRELFLSVIPTTASSENYVNSKHSQQSYLRLFSSSKVTKKLNSAFSYCYILFT